MEAQNRTRVTSSEFRHKQNKFSSLKIYNEKHNAPVFHNHQEVIPDRYGEFNHNIIRNEIVNDPNIIKFMKHEAEFQFNMKIFNIYDDQEFDIENEDERRRMFDNNNILLYNHNGTIYYTTKQCILKTGFDNAELIVSSCFKAMQKQGDILVKVYPQVEMIKITGIENNNYTRYVSYGDVVINSRHTFNNKRKAHGDLLKLDTISSAYIGLEESSSNKHWLVGSLRGAEELVVLEEIRRTHEDNVFIGIGENLYRFDDMAGIYFNYPNGDGDKERISKYKSNTLKPDGRLRNKLLTIEDVREIYDDYGNPEIVLHSTDVAYYISNILNLPIIENNIRRRIVQYHTFNVYTENKFKVEYDFARIKREDHIYYKPNGNETAYIHDDVNIANIKLTKELVERCFTKDLEYSNYNIVNPRGFNIDILQAYNVVDEMAYISVKITPRDDNKIKFHSRYHGYVNKYMLIKEAQKQKDERFKFGDLKIVSKPDTNFEGNNYEYFRKWIDGDYSDLNRDLYSVKETDKYLDGYYYFDDDMVFLRVYKNNENDEYLYNEINNDKLYYQKINVNLKINKVQMNKVMSMYRGMQINKNTIKNAIQSIINVANEEWKVEMDYEYAHILAVFAARYVAKINQSIQHEIEMNKEIYQDKLYEEKLSWEQQIKNQFDNAEKAGKEAIHVAKKIINSTIVDNIIESQRVTSTKSSIWTRFKIFFITIYIYLRIWYLSVKDRLVGLSDEEAIFVNAKNPILDALHNRKEYNMLGTIIKTSRDLFNKYTDKLVFSNFELLVESFKYGYNSYIRNNVKFCFMYLYLCIMLIPVIGTIIYALVTFCWSMYNIDLESSLLKLIFLRDLKIWEKIGFTFLITIVACWNEHFNKGMIKHIITIITTIYGTFAWREFKLFVLAIKMYVLQGYRLSSTLTVILIFSVIDCVSCQTYSNAEYVQLIDYNPGTCTMNDVAKMFTDLTLMYKNMDEYVKREKLTERISHKFQILDIRKPQIIHPEKEANRMPLVQKGFRIDGYNVDKNMPLKLHDCFWCECEAVYRQVQSKIDYDDKILDDFKIFAHKKIDELMDPFLTEIIGFKLEDYYKKLGVKRHEFEQGYLDYQTYNKMIKTFRMHVKIDEKIYMNYGKYKMKARNIAAQNKSVKLLMGIICEINMMMLHTQEWSGPGSTNDDKCKLFENWIAEIGSDCGVLCADGSAFDSTQHKDIQNIVDNYAFEKIITKLSFLNEFGSIEDYKKICYQQDFKIYSKWFTYKCKGTQMSGRMNTCLGNTMRSWLYVEYIKYKMHEERPWIDIARIHEMVNGDDQIIFMRRQHFEFYQEVAYKYVYNKEDAPVKHGLGQVAKIFDKYPQINGAEFLSCILLYDSSNNKCMMVRKLERFLQLSPYTFSNKYTNIYKFRYLNGQLLIADAQNILSTGNNLSIYKLYAYKMLEIGTEECKNAYNKICHNKKYLYRLSQKLQKHKEEAKHKSYNSSMVQDRNNDKDSYIFDKMYYLYLEKQYNITIEDIEELITTINNINSTNYLSKFRCHIIDKLMKVENYNKYLETEKEINKTKIDVEIHLEGSKMNIIQYHHEG